MPTRETLLLFDIDGTLLDTGGAGIEALERAFAREFPAQAARMPKLDLAGATDSGLVRNIFNHAEIDHTPQNESRFLDAYIVFLREHLPTSGGQLLPGIPELLDATSSHPDATVGLLTGNIERGARVKIEHYGIGHHFGFGSYGDDHHDRNELGPIAIDRAAATTGKTFSSDQVFILGDTVKDIRCARAAGARAIAVATGSVSRGELESHSPDFIFDDFADTAAVLQALLPDG